MPLITQQFNCNESGQHYHSSLNPVDKGNSHIFARNRIAPSDDDTGKKTHTVILGYSKTGYPFQLVFKGLRKGDALHFINRCILPYVDVMEFYKTSCVTQLERLLRDIVDLARVNCPIGLGFAMSLSMTYSDESTVRCAGLSIGFIHPPLIKKKSGKVEQIQGSVYTISTSEAHTPGCIFDLEVCPGDEVVDYSRLPLDSMRSSAFQFYKDKTTNSLFYTLISDYKALQLTGAEMLYPQSYEDNFIIGRMIIPDSKMRHRVICYQLINEAMSCLSEYTQHNKLSFLFNKPALTRANRYLTLLQDNYDNPLIGILIIQELFKSTKDKDLQQYITKGRASVLFALITDPTLLKPLDESNTSYDKLIELKNEITRAIDHDQDGDFLTPFL